MYKVSNHSTRNKILLTILVLGVLAGLAYGSWYFYDRSQTRQAEEAAAQAAEEVAEDVVEVKQETYSSREPALEFTYPNNWAVAEDEEAGTILVRSPALSFQTVDGASVDGHFKIYLRQGAREQDRAYIGRGIAARASETLTYTEPTENQREETSISFFGLDSSDNFAYFFIAGNFVLEPGQSLGGEYGADEDTYIIGGGYSSPDLADDLAVHSVPLDSFDETDEYATALDIIRSIRIGRF
ncbi:MAG: hypothetical protein WD467_00655 [Candidatus Saccharimonadales bacterium]